MAYLIRRSGSWWSAPSVTSQTNESEPLALLDASPDLPSLPGFEGIAGFGPDDLNKYPRVNLARVRDGRAKAFSEALDELLGN